MYFPGDGKVKTVPPHHIRPVDPSNGPLLRRTALIGQQFWDDGDANFNPGRWKIRAIMGNAYICVRLSGDGMNCEHFDVGYVMRCITAAEAEHRERGPEW